MVSEGEGEEGLGRVQSLECLNIVLQRCDEPQHWCIGGGVRIVKFRLNWFNRRSPPSARLRSINASFLERGDL